MAWEFLLLGLIGEHVRGYYSGKGKSGSTKQVSWAESIREKAIRSGKISEASAAKQADAKWWIDNRDRF